MSEVKKLPKRVQGVIDRVKGGQRLCKFFRNTENGGVEIVFLFEPSGKKAPPKSSMQAIDSGELKPVSDGLFGAETSQTWIAA